MFILKSDKRKGKIKTFPGISLTELREQKINLIPLRTHFLNQKKKIKTSQEDNIIIKEISENNTIILIYIL